MASAGGGGRGFGGLFDPLRYSDAGPTPASTGTSWPRSPGSSSGASSASDVDYGRPLVRGRAPPLTSSSSSSSSFWSSRRNGAPPRGGGAVLRTKDGEVTRAQQFRFGPPPAFVAEARGGAGGAGGDGYADDDPIPSDKRRQDGKKRRA
jgi:hypothetical protein